MNYLPHMLLLADMVLALERYYHQCAKYRIMQKK